MKNFVFVLTAIVSMFVCESAQAASSLLSILPGMPTYLVVKLVKNEGANLDFLAQKQMVITGRHLGVDEGNSLVNLNYNLMQVESVQSIVWDAAAVEQLLNELESFGARKEVSDNGETTTLYLHQLVYRVSTKHAGSGYKIEISRNSLDKF